MVDVIEAALECVTDFYKILTPSFGPYGKEVLIRNNIGTMFVTNKGLLVLQHLTMKHPLGVLIKKTIEGFVEREGDGSKSYVIVLHSIVHSLYKKILLKNNSSLVSMLSNVSKTLLLLCDQLQYSTCLNDAISPYTVCVSLEQFQLNYMDSYVNTFLCGQYSLPIKETFVRLFKTLFSLEPFKYSTIEYLIKYFDYLYIDGESLDFRHSKVIKGVLIQRESVPRKISQNDGCRFILITGDLSRMDDLIETSFKNESSLHSHLASCKKFYDKLVQVLVTFRITLVLTENSIPNYLQNLLLLHGITYVSFIPTDDIHYVCTSYRVTPFSRLYDVFYIAESSIGKSKSFTSCVVGTRFSSHIGPAVITSHTSKPCVSLVVTTPHKGIGIEYKKTILKLLKSFLAMTKANKCLLIPVGGVFESVLIKYIQSKNINLKSESCFIKEIVLNGLMEIIKVLSDNCCQNKKQQTDVTISLLNLKQNVGDMNSIDGKTGEVINSLNVTSYESFFIKLNMVVNVLQLGAQIFKITDVVPVRSIKNVSIETRELEEDEKD